MSDPSQSDAPSESGSPRDPGVSCGYDLRGLAGAEQCPECGTSRGPVVPCVECGYDLRGLPESGDCPECGTPTARSRTGNLLKDASPDWLRLVVRGHRLVTVGMVGMVTSVIVGVVVSLTTGLAEAILGTGVAAMIGSVVDTLMQVLAWVWLLMMVGGTVLLTLQDPRESLREPWSSSRNVARAGLAVTIVIGAAFSICAAEPFGIPATVSRPVVGLLLTAAVSVATVALLLWLARLLEKVPDGLKANQARRDARRFGLLFSATVVAGLGTQIVSLPAIMATKSGNVIHGTIVLGTFVLMLMLIGQCAGIARLMFRAQKVLGTVMEESISAIGIRNPNG